ncbi:hypothetical protein CURTO8I2_150020 [Curtobacterium sp. 8I-2]|nr:hypothetical protein CURTO8I2_150020 [Curtobacterium sp. 8I-2]
MDGVLVVRGVARPHRGRRHGAAARRPRVLDRGGRRHRQCRAHRPVRPDPHPAHDVPRRPGSEGLRPGVPPHRHPDREHADHRHRRDDRRRARAPRGARRRHEHRDPGRLRPGERLRHRAPSLAARPGALVPGAAVPRRPDPRRPELRAARGVPRRHHLDRVRHLDGRRRPALPGLRPPPQHAALTRPAAPRPRRGRAPPRPAPPRPRRVSAKRTLYGSRKRESVCPDETRHIPRDSRAPALSTDPAGGHTAHIRVRTLASCSFTGHAPISSAPSGRIHREHDNSDGSMPLGESSGSVRVSTSTSGCGMHSTRRTSTSPWLGLSLLT